MQRPSRPEPRRPPRLRAALGAAAMAAFLSAPAAAQSSGRIFDGSLLPSFARLRNVVSKHLLIPVQGVTPDNLRDSYLEGRSGGRTHHAIDIHAPHNTPVLAVADGTILKLHKGGLGGTTIYHLDDDGTTRYYYAHLDHYADGLTEGQRVHKGDVIGYVGDSGNAAPGDYHLHFAVAFLSNLHRWWDGETVNPFYLLRDGSARIEGREEMAGDDRATAAAPVRLAAVAVERPRRTETRERSETRALTASERAAVTDRLEREERAARHRCIDGEEGRARRRCLEAVGDRFNAARTLLAKHHQDPRICTAATAPASEKHTRHASSSSRRHSSAPAAGPCSPRSERSASSRDDDSRESRATSNRESSKGEHASTRRSRESASEERSSSSKRHNTSRSSSEERSSSSSRRHTSEKSESSAHRSRTTHDSESGGGSHRRKTSSSSSHRESSSSRTHHTSSSRSGRSQVPRERSGESSSSKHRSSSSSHAASSRTTRHHKKSE